MTADRPPRLASLLLACFGPMNEALAGDLIETYRATHSRAWYWQQVLVAVSVSAAHDIRTRPLMAIRAAVTGWGVLLIFFGSLGDDMNRFLNGWVLDQLIFLRWEALAAGTDAFVMLYATKLHSWPAAAVGFLMSGWLTVRLHRSQAAAAIAAFALTVIAASIFAPEVSWLFARSGIFPRLPLRLAFVMRFTTPWAGFLLVPALIAVGGLCGASGSRCPDTRATLRA